MVFVETANAAPDRAKTHRHLLLPPPSTSRTSLSERPDRSIPLALALADSLLLCVLQEPLPDPSVSHIKALLSRLEVSLKTQIHGQKSQPLF